MFSWLDRIWRNTAGKIPGDIADWVHSALHGLYSFLSAIFLPVSVAWGDFENTILQYTSSAIGFANQVVRHIQDILSWIGKEGYEVYYYISHPDKLVVLLWDSFWAYVEYEAFNLARQLGRFFFALFYKNMRTFITIVEDILDAVL
jgi:hypothetical protein